MNTKIAHITDSHLDEEFPTEHGIQTRRRLDIVLEDIEREGVTEIVCTGDIGENEGITYFFEQTKMMDLTITLGNHDSFSKITKHFSRGAHYDSQKLYYSVPKEHQKFIYLDSSEGIIDKQQLLWLEAELSSIKPIVFFMHHPIIGLNLMVDKIGGLKNSKAILSLLENTSNDITLFCGHYHMESSTSYKNVKQYITPAISFQIEKNPTEIEINKEYFGYRMIELSDHGVNSEVKILKDAV